MKKKELQEHIKKLSELKDLRRAIDLTLKSQELMEKAAPGAPTPTFADHMSKWNKFKMQAPKVANYVPEEKPTQSGPQGGLRSLSAKPKTVGSVQKYVIGLPGAKTHYHLEHNMAAPQKPWSISHVQSSDGSTLSRSPKAYNTKEEAAADLVHHYNTHQWKE